MNTNPHCQKKKREKEIPTSVQVYTPLVPLNCPHRWDQAFQSLFKSFNSTQIILVSTQLTTYAVVRLVSVGPCYISQAPSWSTTDTSTAVKTVPLPAQESSVCAWVCMRFWKRELAEGAYRKQSNSMQLHKGAVEMELAEGLPQPIHLDTHTHSNMKFSQACLKRTQSHRLSCTFTITFQCTPMKDTGLAQQHTSSLRQPRNTAWVTLSVTHTHSHTVFTEPEQ